MEMSDKPSPTTPALETPSTQIIEMEQGGFKYVVTETYILAPEDLPQIENLITEDDTPMDNIFSERQQRLLAESLYSSWSGPGEGRPFLALANVALYHADRPPPLVPDVMLSLDVTAPKGDIWAKENRSYFVWKYGKSPEVVIEIVSNKEGGENTRKWEEYQRMGVTYYVIFDPTEVLKGGKLGIYALREGTYEKVEGGWLQRVGLGLKLWRGNYEGIEEEWLRWCNQEGEIILTGAEQAEQERQRVEQEHQRAEQEHQRAEQEHQRAERLAAQLRALGIEPENGENP